jgi:uncharacterized protein (TIGR00369 family)
MGARAKRIIANEGGLGVEEVMAFVVDTVPFWRTLGFTVVAVTPEEAVFDGEYRPDLTQGGILHGGVVASLIDSVCACAAIARTYPQHYATTVNLQVAYTKSVTGGRLRAVGRCVHTGGRVLFCEAHVRDEQGELVGHGTSQLLRVPLPASH